MNSSLRRMSKGSAFSGCTLMVLVIMQAVEGMQVGTQTGCLEYWEKLLDDFEDAFCAGDYEIEEIAECIWNEKQYKELRESYGILDREIPDHLEFRKDKSYALLLTAILAKRIDKPETKLFKEIIHHLSKGTLKWQKMSKTLDEFLQKKNKVENKAIRKSVLIFLEQKARVKPQASRRARRKSHKRLEAGQTMEITSATKESDDYLQVWKDFFKDFDKESGDIDVRRDFPKIFEKDETFRACRGSINMHTKTLRTKLKGAMGKIDPETGLNELEAYDIVVRQGEYSKKLIAFFLNKWKYERLLGKICKRSYPRKPKWSNTRGDDGAETLKGLLDEKLNTAEITSDVIRKIVIESIGKQFEQYLTRVCDKIWKRRKNSGYTYLYGRRVQHVAVKPAGDKQYAPKNREESTAAESGKKETTDANKITKGASIEKSIKEYITMSEHRDTPKAIKEMSNMQHLPKSELPEDAC